MKTYMRVVVYSCSRQLEDTVVRLERQLGLSRSQLFMIAFMDYLKEKGLLKSAFS